MFNLKPKEEKFFEMFSDSARLVQKGAYILKEVFQNYEQLTEKMKAISDVELEADELNDAIIDRLNQMFITPLDREDIYALATTLDDVVDSLQGTMERMVLYRTGKPGAGSNELVRFLTVCTDELVKVFDLLHNIKENQHKILDHTRKIVVIESEGDRIYRQEVASLFSNCSDPIEIIKWKEVLEHLEVSIDQCESIADLVRGVVMKYA